MKAYGVVRQDLQQTIAEPVPLHLRNAVDWTHESFGLWKGIRVRARHRGESNQHVLPTGKPELTRVL